MTEPEFLRGRFDQLAAEDLPVPSAERVIQRGRQRRRNARRLTVSAVAAAAVLAIAGGQLAAAALTARLPAAAGHAGPALCPAAPDQAVKAGISAAAAFSAPAGTYAIALTSDGSDVYVQTTKDGYRGITEESAGTGRTIREVMPLAAGQLGGALGGPALGDGVIWTDELAAKSATGTGWSPMYVFSPEYGLSELEPPGQSGGTMGPPVIRNEQFAAWVQQNGGGQEIVEADLATRLTAVLGHGQVSDPVFVGDTLTWDVVSNGAPVHLVARNGTVFPASQRAPVPAQLRQAGTAALIGSNGTATAYITQNLRELFYSAAPGRAARLLVRLSAGTSFSGEPPVVGDGYLGWTVTTNRGAASVDVSYLASLRSFAVSKPIATGLLSGPGQYVLWATAVPGAPADRSWHVLSADAVAALRCPSPARSRP